MAIDEIITPEQHEKLTTAGFAIVPREPTEWMMNSGLYQASHDATWADVYSSWKDMLAAAEAA